MYYSLQVKWCRNDNCHRQDRRQTTDGTGELWGRGDNNISTEKLCDGIKRITSGKGVDIVFDCVVNNETIDSSLKILANSGKLVIVGVNKDPVYLNPITLTMKEASIAGSFVGTKYELQMLVDLAMVGKLRGVVNTKYRLDQVSEALTALKEGKIIGRTYFDPHML
jgi:propanol-preferring alcohol dehydrogenase